MSLEYFTGEHLPTILSNIRAALGPDACVVQLRRKGNAFELFASDGSGNYSAAAPAPTTPAAAPDFRDVLSAEVARDDKFRAPVGARSESQSRWAPPAADRAKPAPIAASVRAEPVAEPQRYTAPVVPPVAASRAPERPSFMGRPWVVALVGPTGAGKTTTIAKLATNATAFGSCRVGLIGLDTYRVGAVEQLETYADLADLPVAIAYTEAEVTRALARMDDCEVVLVDTPGRGPRNTADTETIRNWLTRLAPDEVHLTLPAGQLPAVTRRLLRAYEPFGITHVLATKLDEYPAETAIFAVANEHNRRMRWVTDGQEVPADIRSSTAAMAAALARRDELMAQEFVA